MNKTQIAFEKCKRIAGNNTKCLSILLKLLDLNREDILEQINDLNQMKYNTITSEGIVTLYTKSNEDINEFIKVYDNAMNNVAYIRKNFYNDYEKGMEDFCKG